MSWLKSMMEKEPPEPEKPIGTVAIGTLEPDMHETPKEMVRKALKRAGFKTIDLGKAVSPQNFASKAKETGVDIVAASINTKPAKDNLSKLNQALVDAGLKGKVVLMIGGAAVTKEDAEAIGALYGKSKEEAVALAQKAMEEKKK